MFVSGGGIHTQTYPNIKQKSTPFPAKELSLHRRPSETKGSISRKKTIPNPLFIGPIPQKGMACGKKACSALSCSTKADTVIQNEAQKCHSVLWKMPSNIESWKTYTYANTCVEWERAKPTECALNRQVYTKNAACTSTWSGTHVLDKYVELIFTYLVKTICFIRHMMLHL